MSVQYWAFSVISNNFRSIVDFFGRFRTCFVEDPTNKIRKLNLNSIKGLTRQSILLCSAPLILKVEKSNTGPRPTQSFNQKLQN